MNSRIFTHSYYVNFAIFLEMVILKIFEKHIKGVIVKIQEFALVIIVVIFPKNHI